MMSRIVLNREEISTKRKSGVQNTQERRREREREYDDDNFILCGKEYKGMAKRLKTGVEPIWFEIMPCASFYSVLRSTPEVSRMFQRYLEYMSSTFYNKA